jgi:WD40 repeat protein
VLAQDGTARRQLVPAAALSPRDVTDRPDLRALAVRKRTAYLGLDTELIELGLDAQEAGNPADHRTESPDRVMSFSRRPAQLVITAEQFAVLDEDDRLWRVDLSRETGRISEAGSDRVHRIHESATPGSTGSTIVAATGPDLRLDRHLDNPRLTGVWARMRSDVTCLGSGGRGLIVAGLADGTASVITSSSAPGPVDLLAGPTSPPGPVTAVAVVDADQIVTGSGSGEIRILDSQSERPPQLAARRSGVTAIVVAQSWIVVGDAHGYVSLWWSRPLRLVHEIGVGGPVTALAVDGTLVVARTAHGTLWVFDLDEEPDPVVSGLLTEALSATPADPDPDSDSDEPGPLAIDIVDDAMAQEYGYQVVAVRVFEDDRPLEVQRAGGRTVDLDGLLDLPLRPEPGEEWRIDALPSRKSRYSASSPPPPSPSPSGPPTSTLVVELDVVSRALTGYTQSVRLPVEPPQGVPSA